MNIVLLFAIIAQVIFQNQSYNKKYERPREGEAFPDSGTPGTVPENEIKEQFKLFITGGMKLLWQRAD